DSYLRIRRDFDHHHPSRCRKPTELIIKMKRTFSLTTARVTTSTLFFLASIALICLPLSGSFAANAKRQSKSAVRQQRFVAAENAAKNPGPETISTTAACTPVTVVTNSRSAADDMQANHHILSTSVC